MAKRLSIVLFLLAMAITALPVSAQDVPTLTVYSGRNENLVGPLLEQFERDSSIRVEVRYGDTADLAVQIREEGDDSPADIFFAQDAGALGLLAENGQLAELPISVLDLVEPRFRSPDGLWVGITGRARTLVYNTDFINPEDLPDSILDFTDSVWEGRVGWAPENASFQAFVTALRVTVGDEVTQEWLAGMVANDVKAYPKNSAIVEAVATGEIEVGFVNHYYAYRKLAEDPEAPVANYFFPGGDIGSMINVAGAGILATSDDTILAQRFLLYLLSIPSQQYFADETFEYPLLVYGDFDLVEGLLLLDEYETPEFDLSDLSDLATTLDMLEEVGAFE